MDEPSIRARRFLCIEQGRHLFVLDGDHAGGAQGRFFVVGSDDRYLLACEADDVLRQQRYVAYLASLQPARDVGSGQHRTDAGKHLSK